MPEQVFLQERDVSVTSTLVALSGGKTYATANITSVSTAVVPAPPPNIGCPIVLLAIGAFGAMIGLLTMVLGEVGGGLLALFFLGGVPIGGGILWLVNTKKPVETYALMIASAAGETEGMRSADRAFVARVADAILRAIAARG